MWCAAKIENKNTVDATSEQMFFLTKAFHSWPLFKLNLHFVIRHRHLNMHLDPQRPHTVNKDVYTTQLFQCLIHSCCDAFRLPHIYTQRETAASWHGRQLFSCLGEYIVILHDASTCTFSHGLGNVFEDCVKYARWITSLSLSKFLLAITVSHPCLTERKYWNITL